MIRITSTQQALIRARFSDAILDSIQFLDDTDDPVAQSVIAAAYLPAGMAAAIGIAAASRHGWTVLQEVIGYRDDHWRDLHMTPEERAELQDRGVRLKALMLAIQEWQQNLRQS
ncbi:hypothetical protein [Siccirubricoccus phaeus]|uniref:hypothetical protein n=1 Tax=Siccirubricoccus phaeus TaxID=2595053 RepID=UPI0011F2AAEC|nr:hypothetical protein [Siccirubricoccus phaeus]